MFNCDLLAAVVRDRSCSSNLGSWMFFTGASVMFLVSLFILTRRKYESVKDDAGEQLE